VAEIGKKQITSKTALFVRWGNTDLILSTVEQGRVIRKKLYAMSFCVLIFFWGGPY
jgi:hypothetical protein